jgi:hypothetical protein
MKNLFVLAFATFLSLPLHAQLIHGVQPQPGTKYDLKSGQELVLNIDEKRIDFVCDINPYVLDPGFGGRTEMLNSDDSVMKSRKFSPETGDPGPADGDGNYRPKDMTRDFLNWGHGYDPYFHVNCLSTEEFMRERKCSIHEGADGFGGKQEKVYINRTPVADPTAAEVAAFSASSKLLGGNKISRHEVLVYKCHLLEQKGQCDCPY